MSELETALRVANDTLQWVSDPDDDFALLSRQLIRQTELLSKAQQEISNLKEDALKTVGRMKAYAETVTAELQSKYIQAVASKESAFDEGVASVLTIRCLRHLLVPQFNRNEHSGGECGACIAEEIKSQILPVPTSKGSREKLPNDQTQSGIQSA